MQDNTSPSPFGSVLIWRGSRGGIPDVSPHHSPFRTTLSLANGGAMGLVFLVTVGMTLPDDAGGLPSHRFFSLVPMDPKAAICPSSTKHVSRCIVRCRKIN